MKSRWRNRNAGKGKNRGEGGREEGDGVMFMGRGIEVVKKNKVLEVKEVVRLWPLNVISSNFLSLELEIVTSQANRVFLQLEPKFG